MKLEQKKYDRSNGWETTRLCTADKSLCNLVMVFGSSDIMKDPTIFETIKAEYHNAEIVMNSTAGEIHDVNVNDESLSLTAIWFEKTQVKTASTPISIGDCSLEVGKKLVSGFEKTGLKNILVISDGLRVNGSELVSGLRASLPENTIITGGLAGDGSQFKSTLVGLNSTPQEGILVAIGFYGDALSVSYGSIGGWDCFGPERLITKAKANVLYELDGQPALDVYKKYLGEYAKDLPGSGLLFPLSIKIESTGQSLVRTILAINEEERSLTFAGNMPEGTYAQLMKASLDRLVEGACDAANNSNSNISSSPDLAILISCVGRKLVLDQRIEEEVEVIRQVYGEKTALTGFYSYGEISPSLTSTQCELHNQTMTITTFTEK